MIIPRSGGVLQEFSSGILAAQLGSQVWFHARMALRPSTMAIALVESALLSSLLLLPFLAV
jgi:hypothetical protein